jgi:hypothetical protein
MTMRTTPNTMWCTCVPPLEMFPGHQRTWARIMRTENRIKAKLARNATKKQNSGNRPVCTIWVVNHPDIWPLPAPPRPKAHSPDLLPARPRQTPPASPVYGRALAQNAH